jgi:putative pyruvate formate lyase activating enzyme
MSTEADFFPEVDQLKEILKSCVLCPRKCKVNRQAGELGFCRLADDVVVSHALPHYGEEPPISGSQGAGTIFLSSCNLKCTFCQNYQISQSVSGTVTDIEDLSVIMLALRDAHCHNIEIVTPTPHVPQIMEAFLMAQRRGLNLPLVYNCGGYENPEVLKLLEGMVDIYLPDFKYGIENDAFVLSGAKDYPRYALASIREMVRQVGDSLWEDESVAKRGIVIRHLILPGFISNSLEVLRLIKTHLSPSVPLSIMSQYTPIPAVKDHPHLGRRITRAEYEHVINYSLDIGFEKIFSQEVNDQTLTPDFEKKIPFTWA